jgi:hypothetical protein
MASVSASALSNEASFVEALSEFSVVRSRIAYNCGAGRRRAPRRAAAPAAAPAAQRAAPASPAATAAAATSSESCGAAAAQPAPASAPTPPRDLWGGVAQLVDRHFAPQAREAVSARFGELHYAGLRALNLEDIDDIAKTILRESLLRK